MFAGDAGESHAIDGALVAVRKGRELDRGWIHSLLPLPQESPHVHHVPKVRLCEVPARRLRLMHPQELAVNLVLQVSRDVRICIGGDNEIRWPVVFDPVELARDHQSILVRCQLRDIPRPPKALPRKFKSFQMDELTTSPPIACALLCFPETSRAQGRETAKSGFPMTWLSAAGQIH